jgi:ABC-type amino acid transport substrate-binding protein
MLRALQKKALEFNIRGPVTSWKERHAERQALRVGVPGESFARCLIPKTGAYPARAKFTSDKDSIPLVLLSAVLLLTIGCSKREGSPGSASDQTKTTAQPSLKQAPASLVPTENAAVAAPNSTNSNALALPTSFGKHTGDLDEMNKQRSIRALVIINRIGFFYQNGQPQGIQYEALQAFEKFVNERLKTGTLKVKVFFIPMRPDQLEAALTQGVGDIIAQGVTITPEREQRVLSRFRSRRT